MALTAGYDIGGAHLKVALVDGNRVIACHQIVCALWRGVDQLDAALAQAAVLTGDARHHAVTMTGELADVFPDRHTGVARIVERTMAALRGDVRFWMGSGGFGTAAEAERRSGDVASANFLATATLVADRQREGLLIDMGSTTTDIVPFAGGRVRAIGLTDAARLATGELVYTGLTRTPVMAVATRALFRGQWQTLARDPFATMADVRRILGQLPDGVDQHGTADGRGTSVAESRARLARCFGHDADAGSPAAWATSAEAIAEEQLRSIHDGALQVLSASAVGGHVVVAGIGAEVAAAIAGRLDRHCATFASAIGAAGDVALETTRAAPAAAVALLLAAAS